MRRIAIAARRVRRRCWLVHRWGEWTSYEVTRPVRCIGPSLRHVVAIRESRRRRECSRCALVDDRLVYSRSMAADEIAEGDSSVPAHDLQR
jgi:hypothetical protein